MKKILIVCMGNICRSPAAEGILKVEFQKAGFEVFQEGDNFADVFIDSAGTHSYHIGSPPDSRSVEVCQKYGIDISNYKARRLEKIDGEIFDLILVMDSQNMKDAKEIISPENHFKIHYFSDSEVADPYYGGKEGFEKMFAQLRKSAVKWVNFGMH